MPEFIKTFSIGPTILVADLPNLTKFMAMIQIYGFVAMTGVSQSTFPAGKIGFQIF